VSERREPAGFYGADQAAIHHSSFGDLAGSAARMLVSLLAERGIRDGTVVDLGCGSGILARAVSDAGFDVTGVDISPSMIELAEANAPAATFHCGSLLDFDLPPAVAVTAIGEALNYAADERAGLAEVERLAGRVLAALHPAGVFLLDIATPGRAGASGHREVFHDRGGWVLHMRAQESADRRTLDRSITIFTETDRGLYRRADEHHGLRLYEPGAVLELLRRVGFDAEALPAYDAQTSSTPQEGWIVVRARPGVAVRA
jgi:SAM-dependent methyltransferase